MPRTGLWERRPEKKDNGILHNYDFIKCMCHVVQTLFRIPLCLLLANVDENYSVRTVSIGVIFLLFAVPHSVMWGSYIMSLYQWGAINHHTRANKLASDMFKKNIMIFWIASGAIVIFIFVAFALYLFLLGNPAQITGPIILTLLTAMMAAAVFFVGRETMKLMDTLKGKKGAKAAGKKRSVLLSYYVNIITICLLIQSIVWIVTASVSLSEEVFLTGFVAFYVCDLIILFTQMDLILGFHGLKKVSSWASSAMSFRSISSRSNVDTSSLGNTDSKATSSQKNFRGSNSSRPLMARKPRHQSTKFLYPKLDKRSSSKFLGASSPRNLRGSDGGNSSFNSSFQSPRSDGKGESFAVSMNDAEMKRSFDNGSRKPDKGNDRAMMEAAAKDSLLLDLNSPRAGAGIHPALAASSSKAAGDSLASPV